ncbi:hypothetical protein [Nocardia sp. XZ_19_385]|uniref:hypothetical protein n=1 Tax=Nocardia sp. XZ_19_385 TaxID=2769488 RepID=UPI00188E5DB9|nr:hypothetical protein [Nocardia sp. XZ_19_385]
MSDRITEPTARLPLRVGVVAAVCAAMSATALLGAPGAGATATRLGIFADINVGSATNYGTGCTYTVQAFVTDPVAPVYFYDNGIPLNTIKPTGGVAILKWVPATTGLHTLGAVQVPDDIITATVDVRVGTGQHLGYGCVVHGG